MVQTEQQYICIHQCLMAVLEGNENNLPPREIHDNQGYEGECWLQDYLTNNSWCKGLWLKFKLQLKLKLSLTNNPQRSKAFLQESSSSLWLTSKIAFRLNLLIHSQSFSLSGVGKYLINGKLFYLSLLPRISMFSLNALWPYS